ncbi:MAG: glycoside hydrolase [Flavobacteriales bacterium]|jgi:lysozyme|nr:glycoside hydrolase [Flavobacteriales bacterium]
MLKIYTYILICNTLIILSSCNTFCQSFKENGEKIYGIDVSHYQNETSKINWRKVSQNKNPKIEFAYIRSTMGSNGKDTAFQYNYENAIKNKINVGIYHYYRPNEDAQAQFKNFAKHNTNIGELPPVIDIEQKSKFGSKKLRKELAIFLKLIEENYTKPIIYTQQKFYNMYLRNQFKEYDFWIARQSGIEKSPDNNQPKKEPILLDNRCPLIWQYSGTGTIKGIEGKVDLNITHNIFWKE